MKRFTRSFTSIWLKNRPYVFIVFVVFLAMPYPGKAQEQNDSSSIYQNNRHFFITGYQIGGFTLAGIDYEFKISKHIGIHVGAGWPGFTAGSKIHLSDCEDCPTFNISYKNEGWHSLGTVGIEIGSKLFPFVNNGQLGMYSQAGFGYIVHIRKEKKEQLFANGNKTMLFTFGVGLIW